MRITIAWGLERTCGVVAAICLIAVVAGERAWAQAGDAPQNHEQQNTPQSAPQKGNPPQTSGQMQGQSLPDAPDESKKKEENTNPVEAVADKTKDAATAGLKKARDWESGW